MRYLIIGNSAAAVGAVEAIRQYDRQSPITIVADEAHHVYSRPLISYLLGGTVDETHMYYRPEDFYERHHVETMLGVEVTRINTGERTVSLSGGGQVGYDRLLIATGGKPFVPPLPGANFHAASRGEHREFKADRRVSQRQNLWRLKTVAFPPPDRQYFCLGAEFFYVRILARGSE